jgi:hypothetical protein
MDGKIDIVRRGLEIADAFCGKHTADECPDAVAIPIKDALDALSAIDPEAIRRGARAEALKEAADRAMMWWYEGDKAMTEMNQINSLRAAILSAEPAPDRGGKGMSVQHERYGDYDPCEPYSAAVIAGRIYVDNLARLGDPTLVIAAHRQGADGVERNGPTRWYVERVYCNWGM